MTADEFQRFLGYQPLTSKKGNVTTAAPAILTTSLPDSIDWRTTGKVSAVKDQGDCGGCWAFSATGAIESLAAITMGGSFSSGFAANYSEQQLIDCTTSYGNEGCNGGVMDYAFQYVLNKGICTESNYPYNGNDNKCQTTCKWTAKVGDYIDVTRNNEDKLKIAVAQQPVSSSVQATGLFQHYSSGILGDSSKCGTKLDHAILVVGYDTDATSKVPYWIVKNSWGTSWGENGYIRLQRHTGTGKGTCGIAMQPVYPVRVSLSNNPSTTTLKPGKTTTAKKTTTKKTATTKAPKCTTVWGPYSGYACVFPFIYSGVTYTQCTRVDDTYPWCYVQVYSSGVGVQNKWGYCGSGCPGV